MKGERPEMESMGTSEVVAAHVAVDGTFLAVLANGRVFAGFTPDDRQEFFRKMTGEEPPEELDYFWSEVPPVPGTEAGFKRS